VILFGLDALAQPFRIVRPEADWQFSMAPNATKSVANGNFDSLQRCADHPVPAT